MELPDGRKSVVDPEVNAYVSSLVTALGGSGADEDGRYVLGDDALACLRDLKRWLKLYDEKANRFDVARCLAEANLVGGDLLQILAAWPENAAEDRRKSKIALSCLELLVPLTWPIERDIKTMTVNHHRHIPYLQLAQLGYKQAIINFDGARILHTAVRTALPSMAASLSERSSRDEGIIKLVLYFLRNMAMLAPQPSVPYDGDENDISRAATIEAFHWQDIFHLLLTLCSTMGEDFNTQDVIVMEILFYLIKGVDVEKLFLSEEQLDLSKTDELVRLRNKEAGMKRGIAKTASTRHSRFGTMLWIKRDDDKISTVSGQDALRDGATGLAKLDKAKKFKPPRRAMKGESGPQDFDTPVPLGPQATKNLRAFVEDFLDSGFNPLFQHIRKAIDREAERVLDYHPKQFFYLVSWFLEAERVRRKSKKPEKRRSVDDVDSFALVASALNQEMFITLNRAMEIDYENKAWQDLNAAMKCFTQILLTVQEMLDSSVEDDQDIAENILSRIFYEETTHDRVATIVRYYKDQGFGYLDSCTELAHTYLKMLEQYSKQNVDLQVRSRRRVRRKKKAKRAANGEANDDPANDDSEGEDEGKAARTSSERKFDFKRFSNHFLSQGCVDTFVTYTSYYADLLPIQLKRAHRFFHRVAFKMEMTVLLFRVDIMALFHKMIKGPDGLDPASPCVKEWEELVKKLIKRCCKKIQERPELVVEMLFSKTNSTAHYLEHGYAKQTVPARPRAAAQLEVKGNLEWDRQIGIAVSVLLDKNQGDNVEWVKSQLARGESERRSWEAMNTAMQSVEDDLSSDMPQPEADHTKPPPPSPAIILKADTEARKVAMFKNGHLRLLMTLVGFERLGLDDDPESSWVIPSAMSADLIKEALDLIKKFEFSPPTFDDGQEAEDLIRRKSANPAHRKRQAFDDDDDGIDRDDDDLEDLFPAGGPTARKSDVPVRKKKILRHRRKGSNSDEDDDDEEEEEEDEAKKARREARLAREAEKQRSIKSALYIHDSDEASDEETDRAFFAREEELRKRTNIAVMKSLLSAAREKNANAAGSKKRRRGAGPIDLDDDDDHGDGDSEAAGDAPPLLPAVSRVAARRSSSRSAAEKTDEEGVAGGLTDTPASSPHVRSRPAKRLRAAGEASRTATPAAGSRAGEDGGMGDAPVVDLDEGDEAPMLDLDDDDDAPMVDLEDDEEEELVVPVARKARRKTYGFLADSSDDE